ncbi:hypothetical protein Gotur_012388 [Gossypium turneri]
MGTQYTNIIMYSDGPRKTIVTGCKGVDNGGGITTWQIATFCNCYWEWVHCQIHGILEHRWS